ncbi:MAG: ribonuclease D [Gemmatimonadales bacterium]
MVTSKAHDYQLVTTGDDLDELARRLSQEAVVAVDTEAASFHRYFDRIYLIQISTPHENAVVDPLAVADLTPLRKPLESRQVELVFHDADFDLRSLDRDYGYRPRNVFDTRIAAQLLGEPSIGLGALLEKYYGVKLDKRYQRADWSRRPLDSAMIDYAVSDTAHLIKLRRDMGRRLRELGRAGWAEEEFERLRDVRWTAGNDGEDSFYRLKGAKTLDSEGLGALKALYQWRDAEARSLDRPAFRVVGNQLLIELARKRPRTRKRLEQSGIPAGVVSRWGSGLIGAIKSASPTDPPKRIPKVKRRQDPKAEKRLERLKNLRNEAARRLGLEPGVLCPNGTLQAVAWSGVETRQGLKTVKELRKWQIEALGAEALLKALKG